MEELDNHMGPLSEQQREDALNTLNLVQQEIRAMRGLFRMDIGGKQVELPIGTYQWQSVPGPGIVEIAAVPPDLWPCTIGTCCCTSPCDTDFFYARAYEGTKRENIRVSQAISMELLSGKAWYWKESAPAYVCYEAGDILYLKNNELHSFYVEEDFHANLTFTPKLPLYEE